MKTTIDYAVVGFGPVMQGLVKIARGFELENWNLQWIGRTTGLYDSNLVRVGHHEAIFAKEQSRDLDAVFIGLPSSGDGSMAQRFARHFLRHGVVVETAEKALQACRPGLSDKYGQRFGYNATVGGNVDVLGAIARDPLGVVDVFGIPNTTLNFLRWMIVSGASYSEAIAEAVRLKFMESGNLQEELSDALRKGVILFNQMAKLKHPLRFHDLKLHSVSDEQIRLLLALDCACVVRVNAIDGKSFVDSGAELSVCRLRRGGWQLEVFFQNTFALQFHPPSGDNNIFSITNRAGERYHIFGKGAGVGPTAGTMFTEARQLLGLN